jgi:hypothetical protein
MALRTPHNGDAWMAAWRGDLVLATDPEIGETAPRAVLAPLTSFGLKNLVELVIDTDGPQATRLALSPSPTTTRSGHLTSTPGSRRRAQDRQPAPNLGGHKGSGHRNPQVDGISTRPQPLNRWLPHLLRPRPPDSYSRPQQSLRRPGHPCHRDPRGRRQPNRHGEDDGRRRTGADSQGTDRRRPWSQWNAEGHVACGLGDTGRQRRGNARRTIRVIYINKMGWTPIAGAASRSVCTDLCAALIRGTGGRVTGTVYPREQGAKIRTFEW